MMAIMSMRAKRNAGLGSAALLALALSACTGTAANRTTAGAVAKGSGWCSGVNISFFVGGSAGDAFASIIQKGAEAAATDTGANVKIIYSGWDPANMVSQLHEQVAAKPDAIAMVGHPGDGPLLPLGQQAAAAGILMEFLNVPAPQTQAAANAGFVGSDLGAQGKAVGRAAVAQFGLKAGDKAIVFGPWDQPARNVREAGTADVLTAAGAEVVKVATTPAEATDPNLLTSSLVAAVQKQGDTKLIVLPGGQLLGSAPTYMKALNKQPGDIKVIGFDLSQQVTSAIKDGYVQLTGDQQPYLQGYLPVLSLCQQKKYGFSPLNVDTGAGFVKKDNVDQVAPLAAKSIR